MWWLALPFKPCSMSPWKHSWHTYQLQNWNSSSECVVSLLILSGIFHVCCAMAFVSDKWFSFGHYGIMVSLGCLTNLLFPVTSLRSNFYLHVFRFFFMSFFFFTVKLIIFIYNYVALLLFFFFPRSLSCNLHKSSPKTICMKDIIHRLYSEFITQFTSYVLLTNGFSEPTY